MRNAFLASTALVAMIAAGAPVRAAPAEAPAAEGADAGQEIIVTATKRRETINQVALSISAVTGEQLSKMNANRLEDYITRLPGVVFNNYQPGVSEVVIRGIAATTYHEQGQTTVGYYLNEIPLVEPGFPIGIPDIDTFDLNRVEVLRGPQGTLFGSAALGGLINYVVNTADTGRFDESISGLLGGTKNANDPNYAIKSMINVPIVRDKLAVRLTSVLRRDGGYLDNIGTGTRAANNFRTSGLRGSIVFTPGEGTKITYLAAYQNTKLDDQTYLSVADQLIRSTPRLEPQRTSFFLNSLRLDQDLGFATLTGIGSVDKKTNFTRFTYPYPYVTGNTAGASAAYDDTHANANIKTLEARLASVDTGRFKWLVGASYMHATKYSADHIYQAGAANFITANPALFNNIPGAQLAPNDAIYGYISSTKNDDWGVFGEASYKPIDEVEITVGGRYYNVRNSAVIVNQAGTLAPGSVNAFGTFGETQKEDGFTPKVTLAYRPNRNLTVWATYSRGFREGGPNPNAAILPGLPVTYKSDSVDNYELGIKGSLLDGRLAFSLDGFHLAWHDIQARLFGPAPTYYSYVTNAGGARVNGVEFEGTVAITRQLSFHNSLTYEDAKLNKFLPDTFAAGGGYAAGTTLPGASKWTIANNLTLDLKHAWGAPTFEIAHRYISKSPVAFGATFDRGGFNLVDLRGSVSLTRHIRTMVLVNNLFNKYGILSGPFADQTTPAYAISQPRTFGVRVDWTM